MFQDYVKDNCPQSCGLCPGLTPAASNTCYDMFNNCPDLAETNCHKFGDQCKKSCGLCDGMTPHKSMILPNIYHVIFILYVVRQHMLRCLL